MLKNLPALFVGGVLIIGVGVTVLRATQSDGPPDVRVRVQVPEALSLSAQRGQVAFDANCRACHGANAGGSDQGPPLVHNYYNPGHHADEAFRRAVRFGVRRHHWSFGDMPKQPQVGSGEIEAIIAYVRELQAANGIAAQPHNM